LKRAWGIKGSSLGTFRGEGEVVKKGETGLVEGKLCYRGGPAITKEGLLARKGRKEDSLLRRDVTSLKKKEREREAPNPGKRRKRIGEGRLRGGGHSYPKMAKLFRERGKTNPVRREGKG